MKKRVVITAIALLCGAMASPARAYTHPCIPTTREELDTIKANLDKEPWKTGYAILAADSKSQLDYVMNGPFANVSRQGAYDQYLGAWSNDMTAVYNLSRMWYFTGNGAYAQKARDILIAWANTNTTFNGNEAGLAMGDLAAAFGGGASILRGTWPGWTAADTTTVKNYFANVLWPNCQANMNVTGPCNKGDIAKEAAIAIAVFCDDTVKFDHVVDLYRTYHGSGLMDTLPTGQLGESGRDGGHAFGALNALAFTAEVAYKQGVDLYSELDNRLLACGEYYSRNTYTTDNPYVPYGSIDWPWLNNAAGPYVGNRAAFYILQNAYKNRKGLPTPWIDRKLQDQQVDSYNWMFAKTADFTTANVLSPATFPGVSLASSGLTLTTLGGQTSGRSLSYANGTWTMAGLGSGVWTDGADDCQFAYTQMTGDGAMVARVNSFTYSGSNNGKAGLMIRDNLVGTVSQRAWIGVVPAATNLMENHVRGYTQNGSYSEHSISWSPAQALPYWFKIERRGQQVSTFLSVDGASWHPWSCSYFANLPSTVYIGLHISSGNTTPVTATFDHVAFTGGTGGLVTTPFAPQGVIAVGSSQAITVRWLPSFGATSYNLLRSTTSGGGYTTLAGNLSASTTSYVDTSAAAGTTYYYVVQAANSAGASGNSPQGYSSRITSMVNIAFGGTASASFNTDSYTEGAHKAFDTDPGSKWYGYNSPTGWLQYDFGANNAQTVKRYTINSADVAARDPKDWQFQGSQDGSTWTTLDTRSGQSFLVVQAQNTYDIGNTTAYRYYRLNITGNNGAGGTAISELGLWSDTGRTIPDGRYSLVSRLSNKVIDLTNGGTADGTDAVQWSWNGGNSQKWAFTGSGNGQYQATGVASGKLLEVTGASTANGALVQILPSNGSNGQKWTVTPSGDGFFKLLNVNSGKAADVKDISTADGAAIQQWTYWAGNGQQWLFAPLSMTGITRLQSYNFPTRYVRHTGFHARIDENVSPIEDSEFRVRIGMSNASAVSFESVNFAGYYLRVRSNGEVWVDKYDGSAAFRDSATFERVPGLADSSKSSFRMWTDSTRYLRHSNYWLYAQSGSGSTFNADATFSEVTP
jgi:regulation of enolase protein 1 (concanavalin A-like superfamily)